MFKSPLNFIKGGAPVYRDTVIIGHKLCGVIDTLKNNIVKGFAKLQLTHKKFFFDKTMKTQHQQNKGVNIKILVRGGSRTRDLSHRSLMSNLLTTESNEHIDVVKLFIRFKVMGRNTNKQNQICWSHVFNKVVISVIFYHA